MPLSFSISRLVLVCFDADAPLEPLTSVLVGAVCHGDADGRIWPAEPKDDDGVPPKEDDGVPPEETLSRAVGLDVAPRFAPAKLAKDPTLPARAGASPVNSNGMAMMVVCRCRHDC